MDYRNSPQSDVAPFLARRIAEKLDQGKRVLWLMAGGSGIAVCVEVARLLADRDLSNLSVTISDERYGEPGHPDENMQQLYDVGLSLPGAAVYRPLTGASIEATTTAYDKWLSSHLHDSDYRIALLGIGNDGHTSGIKPHSPAVHSRQSACSFKGEDYDRITTTPAYLSQFDEAVVQAYGHAKWPVIQTLQARRDITLDEFPAGVLAAFPQTTLFTDYKEEMI